MSSSVPHHVAIIMDGNGRWAQSRGLPRVFGHRAGMKAVRAVVETAPRLGIRHLSLYAFSADNWRRPAREVQALMNLLRRYLRQEVDRCVANGVRLSVWGRRDRLPDDIVGQIAAAEARTRSGDRLHLRLLLDYSAREAIARAAALWPHSHPPSREEFARLLAVANGADEPMPEVDLLVRTGGEQRLSDFLLWECAYAELLFVPTMWPDFGPADLEAAVREFQRRERRFGGVPERPRAAAAPPPR
jgi:undecaprenyl diphosphate synthase